MRAEREEAKKETNKLAAGDDAVKAGRSLYFGRSIWGKRSFTAKVDLKIEDNVLEFLQNDELFRLDERGLRLSKFFEKCVDNPKLKDHYYYEGYFHGLEEGNAIVSLHPRKGINFSKPAAPERLRAFIVAMREKNKGWAEKLSTRLQKECKKGGSWLAGLITRGKVAGDLAVQVHWGETITGPDINWHIDGSNSMIHFGLSIRGKRTLRTKTARSQTSKLDDEIEKELQQSAGNAYLASPAMVRHGVEYFQCDWKDRVIAIQCRMLLTDEDRNEYFNSFADSNDLLETTEIVAKCFMDADVQMPTLDDVNVVLKRMQVCTNENKIKNYCIIS
mmetsp:Transcript_16699/g.27571  ORF Transcript_16699/g.27571 Transcript_16699/m.27571 type:complete len:332 (+) Transcript_16699:48-1043(+)